LRSGVGSILGRVVAVIAGLLLVGLAIKLILAILSPVLPVAFMQVVTGGWNMLFGMVGPALPAIMAAIILGALCWVFIGRRR
jgi:hypothetical protein